METDESSLLTGAGKFSPLQHRLIKIAALVVFSLALFMPQQATRAAERSASMNAHEMRSVSRDNSDANLDFSLSVSLQTVVIPIRNAYDTSTPTLNWSAVSWAAGYEIQVDNNNTFGSLEYSNNTIPAGTLSDTTGTLANGVYFWRIRAQRGDGTWGTWSVVDSFAVNAP